jgi:hypothetical protein
MTESHVSPASPDVKPSTQRGRGAEENHSAGRESEALEEGAVPRQRVPLEQEETPGEEKHKAEPPLRVPSFVHRSGRPLETVSRPDEEWPLGFEGNGGKPRKFGSSIPMGSVKILPPLGNSRGLHKFILARHPLGRR